ELADGTTQTSEVYAGSGYYSQSSAAVFFGAPTDNPIRRIRVRWPDGRVSSRDVPNDPHTMVMSHDD
ncbi:MAG TPA: ASPIC/UnbV domain-containing protein, partial [Opitutus sp.]|nr:ASPIC/UnbV domain-containing protein [Opitutus sp.]